MDGDWCHGCRFGWKGQCAVMKPTVPATPERQKQCRASGWRQPLKRSIASQRHTKRTGDWATLLDGR